jgi:hypothetical protein
MTSKFRTNRKAVALLLFLIGVYWAVFVAPAIMSSFLDSFVEEVHLLLAITYPGLMRAVILLLWVMVLVYPISYALQEIRIGQWEIMLSNNVKSRDMLLGMFLGKIPSYSLLILFMAPVLISPFMIIYEVSLIGQLLSYLVIAIFAFSTLLLSTIVSTAIQAKLGDSARGNDIAKAMSLVVVVLFLLPLYSIMYFSEGIAHLLGLDVFLLLPSTWGADIITWITIYFNGIDLPTSSILIFEEILGLPAIIDALLIGGFAVLVIALGLIVPDRLFSFEGGPRTEKVTTVGRENIVLRGIRKVAPGSFGLLLVSTLKDFGRKAQNISKVIYGMFLSILLPIMMTASGLASRGDSEFLLVMISFMLSMVLGMICGITFGGIGFLESKDHLWIIKSTPNGVSKFIKARLVEGFLFGIPIVLVPVSITPLILALGIFDIFVILIHAYIVLVGSILVGVGFTAINPAYENSKSGAFYVNTFTSITMIMVSLIAGLILGVIIGFEFGHVFLGILISSLPLLSLGILIIIVGKMKLATSDG